MHTAADSVLNQSLRKQTVDYSQSQCYIKHEVSWVMFTPEIMYMNFLLCRVQWGHFLLMDFMQHCETVCQKIYGPRPSDQQLIYSTIRQLGTTCIHRFWVISCWVPNTSQSTWWLSSLPSGIVNVHYKRHVPDGDIQIKCAYMHLKLNASKTKRSFGLNVETDWMTTRKMKTSNFDSNCSIPTSDVIHNLGVISECSLNMTE